MKYIWINIGLILVLSCSEELIEPKESEPEIYTESTSVCSCHNSAVSIYKALLIEERLEYKEAFWQLREEWFTQWGVLLFYPSECNDPDYLRMLADSLRLAGIDINSP